MQEIELTPQEIADHMHELYANLADIVRTYLANGDNPGVRVQPYARGVHGRTHFTVGIEGLLTGPTIEFIKALEAMAPGAFFKQETAPDGKPLGYKIHLPVIKTRQVRIPAGGRRQGRRLDYRAAGAFTQSSPTGEWVALLWCVTSALGGLLYYRLRAGLLY